jgi:hypothetical protein
LEDSGRLIAQPLFMLSVYRAPEGGYCVSLLVKYEDPGGWIAVWRRCYGDIEVAEELLNSIEPLARNRLDPGRRSPMVRVDGGVRQGGVRRFCGYEGGSGCGIADLGLPPLQ